MTITSTTLFRAAGAAAALAGLIFIGVQINHPYLDATSITSTDAMTRDSLKMLMAALALVPQSERLFAIPTGLALVGLGYSLWRSQRAPAAPPILNSVSSQLDVVGAK